MATEVAARDRLFETAGRLFYQRGYRVTGVDTIAAASGVGKMTLYRHFPSKDDLIVAFLRSSDEAFWRHFADSVGDANGARECLLRFFESLQAYVLSEECYGCPFLNVVSEYPRRDEMSHRVALEHKRSVLRRFNELADEAGAARPEALAMGLFLLMDGAYMAARMFGAGPDSPAAGLAASARALIETHCAISGPG